VEEVIFERMNTDESNNQGRKELARPIEVEKPKYSVPLKEKSGMA
jgi:hypothetical protein